MQIVLIPFVNTLYWWICNITRISGFCLFNCFNNILLGSAVSTTLHTMIKHGGKRTDVVQIGSSRLCHTTLWHAWIGMRWHTEFQRCFIFSMPFYLTHTIMAILQGSIQLIFKLPIGIDPETKNSPNTQTFVIVAYRWMFHKLQAI
jgi:hypothetical protein